MVKRLLVLLCHLQGALQSLQRDPISLKAIRILKLELLLLVHFLGTQPETIRSLLVGLEIINIYCLAPELVLLFEDDLSVLEWVDEIWLPDNLKHVFLIDFLPLAILLQAFWTTFLGLGLPCFPSLPAYIFRIFIIILLPQLPPVLLILYNDFIQSLPEFVFCYSWQLHPAMLIDLPHCDSKSGIWMKHPLDQVFKTLVQLFAFIR